MTNNNTKYNVTIVNPNRGTNEKKWAVIKDQGEFDYVSGATITPRAVINAVKNALKYFEENKIKLGFTDV